MPSNTATQFKGKILVVEDAEPNQNLMEFLLRKLDFESVIAQNGEEAIAYSTDATIDLVLMDIQMPVMDGVTATIELRKRGFNKPVIALTGNAFNEEFLSAGGNGVLTKPITSENLAIALEEHLKPVENLGPIYSSLINKPPKIANLVHVFLDDLPDMVSKLEINFKHNDIESFLSQAHNLKGTAGNFGFPVIMELCKEIESLAKTDNLNRMPELLGELNNLMNRALAGRENTLNKETR